MDDFSFWLPATTPGVPASQASLRRSVLLHQIDYAFFGTYDITSGSKFGRV